MVINAPMNDYENRVASGFEERPCPVTTVLTTVIVLQVHVLAL